MSYRSDVPDQAHSVRGTDLPAILENFLILGPVAVSGILGISGVDFTGITNGQVPVWNTSQGKFLAGTVSGGGGGTVSGAGEYLCHVTTTTGQSIVIPGDTNFYIVSGCNTARRNVGGFTVGSGSIQIPTGSGYTHAVVRASLRISGGASSTGYRQIAIRISGGAQATANADTPQYFPYGNPWADLNLFFSALTSVGVDTQMNFASPLLIISGGEKFTIVTAHDQGSALGLRIASGERNWLEVQCYKLTSGGVG